MNDLEYAVTIIGIIYGVLLIFVAFVRTPYTEALRIDALFMPNPTDASRPLNFVIGLLIVGYMVYSFF